MFYLIDNLHSYVCYLRFVFFFNDTATTEIYTYGHTLSLHDALPISRATQAKPGYRVVRPGTGKPNLADLVRLPHRCGPSNRLARWPYSGRPQSGDRKSTRLNSSH